MTVENIDIQVKTNADKAASKLNSLSTALGKVSMAAGGLNNGSITSLATAISAISSSRITVGIFNSLATGISRLGDALKTITAEDANVLDKVSRSLARLQGVDLKGMGSALGAARRVSAAQAEQTPISVEMQGVIESATQIDVLEAKLESLRIAMQNAFDAGNMDKAYSIRGQIIQTEAALERATAAAEKNARATEEVGKAAAKASKGGLANFIASLKRIAFYRLLRTIIKEITQAIKEGLENVYAWSKAGGDMGQIASALDRISSAGAQLKNQLGAAFGELLAALEPVIVALINLLTQLAQALTWVIALLSGKGYYPVAKQIAKDWKEADKAAGGYKNTILGFDEINRLNDEGGGGGGGLGGDQFDWEPIEFGLGDLFDNLKTWIAIFKQDIDDGIGKIRDFVAELATIPDTVPVEITVKVPDPLPDPLLAFETLFSTVPVVEIEFAILGNPIPVLNAIRVAIASLIAECPQLQTAFQTALDAVKQTVASLNESYADAVANMQVENSTLGQDVVDTFNRLKNPLHDWISHVWDTVGEYQKASGALQLENETLASDIKTTFENIGQSVRTVIDNVKANLNTFTTETLPAWGKWAANLAENTRLAFDNIAQNVWAGLQNAADNVVSFVNSTAQGFASWAKNTAENVLAWAQNVVTNIGNALKSAWESVKSFAKATGEAIGGFFKENANVIVPVAIGAAIVIGAIALAPATGGASLGAIALAANGGEFPNTGSLFVAGEAGPEIVANMGSSTGVMNVDQMEAAVANGNLSVVNAVYAMANMIVRAIDDKDTDVTLDGESLADKMYRYNQNAANRRGVAMVT